MEAAAPSEGAVASPLEADASSEGAVASPLEAAAPGEALVASPIDAGDDALGETTRRFLAAAGISAHVRRRRQRWAALLLILLLVGIVGIGMMSVPSAQNTTVAAPRINTPSPVDVDSSEESLADTEACRLMGTCAPRRATRHSVRTATPRTKAEIPTPVGIGALETSGGLGASDVAKAQVELPELQALQDDGLSATQTAAIKAKVTPGFKRCKGVFASSKVVVQFSTDSRGKVRKVSVPQGPGRVRQCLLRRARYWRFGRALASRRIELSVAANGGLVR
ncbi:MAG: hypothetical protein AAFV29_27525, partial [Myxococcota bacterium]